MGKSKEIVTISQDTVVHLPPTEPVVPVPISIWKLFMARLKKCVASPRFYDAAGWAAYSAAASFAASAIALCFSVDFVKRSADPKPQEMVNYVALVAAITQVVLVFAFVVIGFLCRRFAKSEAGHQADLIQVILEDMEILGEKYKPPPATADLRAGALAASNPGHSL